MSDKGKGKGKGKDKGKKNDEEEDKDKLLSDLFHQNQKLAARMVQMRKQLAAANEAVLAAAATAPPVPEEDPKPRRASHPRNKPETHHVAPAAPAPPPSPRTPCSALVKYHKKKLSSSPQTRTRTPENVAMVRKILGRAIKLNMDELLQSQHFRDADRVFKLDVFEDKVTPIIDMVSGDNDVDTSMLSRHQMFRLAVDIAKKRERYTPRKALNPTKKRRLRAAKEKKKLLLLLLLLPMLLQLVPMSAQKIPTLISALTHPRRPPRLKALTPPRRPPRLKANACESS